MYMILPHGFYPICDFYQVPLQIKLVYDEGLFKTSQILCKCNYNLDPYGIKITPPLMPWNGDTFSGSSNMIAIDDRLYAIMHRIIQNSPDFNYGSFAKSVGITCAHKYSIVYFSYIVEFEIKEGLCVVKLVSNPIYLKSPNGIHYICGLEIHNELIYISYGMADSDSGVLILTKKSLVVCHKPMMELAE